MDSFKNLDPVLHAQLRLAIMSIVIAAGTVDFSFIKEKTGATAGNLSVQINKLKEAGYIEVEKRFKGNYPQTLCKPTTKGVDAFEKYVKAIQQYLKPGK
jgi:DNA-binding transcriptional ArsR family regulator